MLFPVEQGITYGRGDWRAMPDDEKLARLARVSRQMDTLMWNALADTREKRGALQAVEDAAVQMVGEDWKLSPHSAHLPSSGSAGGITITLAPDPRTQSTDAEWTAQAHGLSEASYRLLAPYLRVVKDTGSAVPMSFADAT